MARLAFDNIADRTYEHGVSRGVLYINETAYVWGGLLSVEESEEGLGAQAYYFDGLKYANLPVSGDFQASVTSLGAPDEFMRIQGLGRIAQGFYIDNQPRQRFDFCYRTEISSAFGSVGHKIHLVYNALATSTGRTNNTITDTHESNSYTWDISTLPETGLSSSRPSAHFILDSTKTDPLLMSVLEGILYGGVGVLPRLLTPLEILDIYQNWTGSPVDYPTTFKGKFETSTHELVNLATNPSFEAPGSTVEVRRNLKANPLPTSRSTYLAANAATITYSAESILVTCTPGVVDSGVAINDTTLPESTTYSFSLELEALTTGQVRFSAQGSAFTGQPGTNPTTRYDLVPGTTSRIGFTVTTNATGGVGSIYVLRTNGAGSEQFRIRKVLVEVSPVLGEYFDGSSSPDPDLTPEWTGAVNASASRLLGTSIVGITQNVGRYCIQSGDWAHSGTKSLRITRTGTALEAAAGAVVWSPASGDVGKTFTAAVWCRPQDGYDGSQDVLMGDRASRGLYVFQNAGMYRQQAEPVAEAQLLRLTFTVTGPSHTLRVGGGGLIGQSVRYDDFTIVEGSHPDLMPFNPHRIGQIGNQEIRSTWDGTEDLSTSTATVLDNLPTGARRGDVWDINGRIYVYDGQIWRAGSLSPL